MFRALQKVWFGHGYKFSTPLSPQHIFLITVTSQTTCQSCSPSRKACMHKSYNIPLRGRKLLPLTQIAPHPCTRFKNATVTKQDKNSTNKLSIPAFLCSSSSPFTEHKPKCLRICQRQLLPVNSQQLLTRVRAMEDGSAAYFAQLLPLSTAQCPSSPTRQ